MIVRLVPGQPPHVVEPEVTTSLAVEHLAGAPPDDDAVAAIGTLDADGRHVWLRVDDLRRAAVAAGVGPGWEDGFEQMLAYAASKGWTGPERGTVRAHCEPNPDL